MKAQSISETMRGAKSFDVVTIAGQSYQCLATNQGEKTALLQIECPSFYGQIVVSWATGQALGYSRIKCRACGQWTWLRWSFARRGFMAYKLCDRCNARKRQQKHRWSKSEQGKRLSAVVSDRQKAQASALAEELGSMFLRS